MSIPNVTAHRIHWALLSLGLLACGALLRRLGVLDEALTNCAAPLGIISLQLAGDQANAAAILQSWARPEALAAARQSLEVDWLFLLAYPATLALACRLLSAGLDDDLAGVGRRLTWAVLACAPLDALENLALWAMLQGGADPFLAAAASLCASLKFGLVFLALAFLSTCLLARLRRRF